MTVVLEVKNLSTVFKTRDGIVPAVNNVSFHLNESETLGIVGESGSGKSVSMHSVMRSIEPPGEITGGEVLFSGRDLLKLEREQMRKIRGSEIAYIPQDPMTFLNPVLKLGFQIAESLIEHRKLSKQEALKQAVDLLDLVGIPEPHKNADRYAFQFSGGMRQRVMIAMALACKPKVLIADEPTTALDVTISAQIINLVKDLQKQFGIAVIWISHDLGVIARLAKRVQVMYAGQVVETASAKTLFATPKHPYTIGLLQSLPRLDDAPGTDLIPIQGQPPKLVGKIIGCPFAPRCQYQEERCWVDTPQLCNTDNDHEVSCWEIEKVSKVKQYD